jgi:small subunit ribosomal protein S4e
LRLLQAPKPSPGPHKTRECLPLILLLRNRLKYALTGKEVTSILMQRLVHVDGKVRTDRTYPVGFMDVVDIPKTGAQTGSRVQCGLSVL